MINYENNLVLLESYLEEKEAYKSRILLEKNDIKYKYLCSRDNFEKTYLTSNSNPTEIWVNEKDFNIAYEIIRINSETNDNYNINVKDFSNKELIDIIKNPDEWHKSFIKEARKVAKERNVSIPENEIDTHLKEKLELIKHGKNVHPFAITTLWITTLFSGLYLYLGFLGFFFSFIGIIVGYLYWKTKITAFDNKKYYLFSKGTRIHGKYIFFIGLIIMTLFLFRVYYIYLPIH